jgi:glycosyltransferase involved in cell wall biosynthesis
VTLLGIDATSVAPDGKGISRVQRGTVRALAALGRHELVVVARHPEELPEVEAFHVSPRLSLEWEQRGLARAAREVDVMLTWTERLPVAGRARFVIWLFEPPTHRIEANRASAGAWQRGSDLVTLALWRRSLRRAALVLAGSNATAAAIRGVAPARTLYPGLDEHFVPGIDEPGDYVLHLGSGDPRDDTATALAAAREAELPLVVAGGYAGPAEGAELMGRVSDEQLVELYRGAAVFLDTSLYEGFGYQVLEAMACGTPVVASDTTSIPELVGDAGLLCPPRDVSAFAAALRRAIDERGELRRRGLARAQAFAWERTARELADAVDQVAP